MGMHAGDCIRIPVGSPPRALSHRRGGWTSRTRPAAQAARAQQGLTAQQQLLSRQALQPLEAAQQFGSGVTQLIAGYPGRTQTAPPAPTPSPLATGLGTASTLAGIYRLINPAQQQIKIV